MPMPAPSKHAGGDSVRWAATMDRRQGAAAVIDDVDGCTRCGIDNDNGCVDSGVTDDGSGCGGIGATEGRGNCCGDTGVIDGRGAVAIGSACPFTTAGGGG